MTAPIAPGSTGPIAASRNRNSSFTSSASSSGSSAPGFVTAERLGASTGQPDANLGTGTFFEGTGSQTKTRASTYASATQEAAANAAERVNKSGRAGKKMPRVLEMCGVNTISHIVDRFDTYEAVTRATRDAGLERCSLIFGIDYTSSNNFQVSFLNRTALKIHFSVYGDLERYEICIV